MMILNVLNHGGEKRGILSYNNLTEARRRHRRTNVVGGERGAQRTVKMIRRE